LTLLEETSSGANSRKTLVNQVTVITGSTVVLSSSLGVHWRKKHNRKRWSQPKADMIGFTIARHLVQDGAHVVVSSQKQQNVGLVVAALKGVDLNVMGTVCHVGKGEDREQLVAMKLGAYQVTLHTSPRGLDFTASHRSPGLMGKCHHSQPHLLFPCRVGWPEDCVGLVSFLCSPDASYITGEIIVVAGFYSHL
ncbi:hypothetical protein E2I00_017499, partial [Balaenoptera physalus]